MTPHWLHEDPPLLHGIVRKMLGSVNQRLREEREGKAIALGGELGIDSLRQRLIDRFGGGEERVGGVGCK